MFTKILIANRGEIAIRVIRACREMGISTVAIFSEADREALHVSLADESFCIGKSSSKDSYLNMKAIISVALVSQAEAIHPGYGFLSENHMFAQMCEDNGIVFIGPKPETIAKMGDKDIARKTMKEAGILVIPGCDLVENLAHAIDESKKIGFPLLIKARAGGGGRGIRRVESADDLVSFYNGAVAEAQAAFGDGAVYMEKYLNPVKHIEMQLLCDHHGNVLCLGERDCSAQRKHQKLIEESPATVLTPEVRKRMIDIAIRAGRAVDYRGAGTLECLYDQDGNFYFMEMNTRLQVEHPVTEMVTGIDLVKWQIRIAAGMKLDFTQEDIALNGHSIECRINAEDPTQDFKPAGGSITVFHSPGGPGVRFDSAIYQGYTVPPFYDSMIGKLIVHAQTRDEAIRKMKSALCELVIKDIVHNANFQHDILSMEEFVDSTYATDFLGAYQ
jgi:acetyl-CoA carboxylase biotin carboxylase subunit